MSRPVSQHFRALVHALTIVLAAGVAALPSPAQTWVDRTPTAFVSPPAREQAAMAFDSARGRAVLFGGSGSTIAELGDTWEWDGQQWAQAFPAQSPPRRYGHAMAFDVARNRVVLFGGYIGGRYYRDTFEWDGSNWQLLNPANSPGIRSNHAMVYDSARQRIVLHGGRTSQSSVLGDTWEWDGNNWIQVSTSGGPSPRFGHVMAYDAHRARTVLFGGSDWTMTMNDTWLWDGSSWSSQPSNSPTGYEHSAMVYDPSIRQCVRFGGQHLVGGSPTPNNTVHRFDSTNFWVFVGYAGMPARQGHVMAYDSARDTILIFGGRGVGGVLDDTWEMIDQLSVIRRQPITGFNHTAGMAYDPMRRRMVCAADDATYEWDGDKWIVPTHPLLGPQPLDFAFARLCYDTQRQRMVLVQTRGSDPGSNWQETMSVRGANGWQLIAQTAWNYDRRHSAIAYDALRDRIVTFGGQVRQWSSSAGRYVWYPDNGTREINSVGSVTLVTTPTSPPTLTYPSLAYDPFGRRVVEVSQFSSTYTYDGADWTRNSVTRAPSGSGDTSLVYDTARSRVLGFAPNGPGFEWDGSSADWTRIANQPTPPGITAIAYDQHRDRVVAVTPTATWEFAFPPHATWVTQPANTHEYALVRATSWTEAESTARALGGHLATVRSQAENDWLVQQFGPMEAWIGFNDEAIEGTWEWSSGLSSAFTHWGPGEPNNAGSGEDFAYTAAALGGRWNDVPDYGIRPGIVERIRSPINRHLYLLTAPMSFAAAEAEARLLGGHLATIRSQAENDWLVQKFGAGDLWIGFNDVAAEGTWVWSSGEPVTYTNWAPGEPNNFNGDEDFAHLYAVYPGRWNDRGRDLPMRGIVELTDNATFLVYGQGCGGSGGVPNISATGRATIGNPFFAITVDSAATNAAAYILLNFARGDVPIGGGCTVYPLLPALVFGTVTNNSGSGSVPLPTPAVPDLAGIELFVQFLVLDSQGPWPPGGGMFAFSRGMSVILGN